MLNRLTISIMLIAFMLEFLVVIGMYVAFTGGIAAFYYTVVSAKKWEEKRG
jgi:hypothetical protein